MKYRYLDLMAPDPETRISTLRALTDLAYERGEVETAETLDAHLEDLEEAADARWWALQEGDDLGDSDGEVLDVEPQLVRAWRDHLLGKWHRGLQDLAEHVRCVLKDAELGGLGGWMAVAELREQPDEALIEIARESYETRAALIRRIQAPNPQGGVR